MSSKPTLQQVAEACGLSIATVDRVLNQRGGVRPDKEQRVLDCARKLKLDRNFDRRPTRILRVAVVTQDPSNPFFARVRTGVQRANQIFSAHSIQLSLYHFDLRTPDATAHRIRKLAETSDALLLSVNEHPLIEQAINQVAPKLPVLSFVSDVPRSSRKAYVGPDNVKAGRVAGDLMGRFLGEAGGDIMLVAGSHQLIDQKMRAEGFRAVLKDRYTNCRISREIETLEQTEGLAQKITEILTRNPSIKGIYNVSAGNQPIAQALKRLSSQAPINFITHELTPERAQLLSTGVLDAIIDQDPEYEVLVAVELVAEHFGRWEGDAHSASTPFKLFLRESV